MGCVLLFSGGVDSTALLAKLLATHPGPVNLLWIGYGNTHAGRERVQATQIAEHYGLHLVCYQTSEIQSSSKLMGGSGTTDGSPWRVPGRNAMFLSLAAAYAEAQGHSEVFIGCNADDHNGFYDCRRGFLERLDAAFQLGSNNRVSIRFPFVDLNKQQIVALGRRHNAPFHLTYSCYVGGELHCGVCDACRLRKAAGL